MYICLYVRLYACGVAHARDCSVGRREQPALATEQRYCPAFPYKHSQGHCDCVPLDSSLPLLHLPAPTIRPSHVPELAIVLPHSLPTPSAASPPPASTLLRPSPPLLGAYATLPAPPSPARAVTALH
jgi:hypothetical protein